jgi:hypothetical protein
MENAMDLAHWLLISSTLVILYVFGQIWLVQIVVYPLFAKVGQAEYIGYHGFYSSRILFPVIIPGFASFLLPLALVFIRPVSVPLWLAVANALCGIVGLLVTVALEIPRHSRLEQGGKDDRVIQELISYNWPRTLSISCSAVLSLAMVFAAFSLN